MHINKRYKLLIYIILILVLNFNVVGCDRIGLSNILSYTLDNLIYIEYTFKKAMKRESSYFRSIQRVPIGEKEQWKGCETSPRAAYGFS